MSKVRESGTVILAVIVSLVFAIACAFLVTSTARAQVPESPHLLSP